MRDEDRMILIGERLKRARGALGYSQAQVAEKLKIGRPRYSDIENGKRDVPLKELYKFCEFFVLVGFFVGFNLWFVLVVKVNDLRRILSAR